MGGLLPLEVSKKDVIGILGTALGGLNSIDGEVLVN